MKSHLIDNNGNKLDNLDISIDGNNIVLTGIKNIDKCSGYTSCTNHSQLDLHAVSEL